MTTVISRVHLIGSATVGNCQRKGYQASPRSGTFCCVSCELADKRYERVEPELELTQSWQPEQQQ